MRKIGLSMEFLITWLSPRPVTTPTRAAISCSTMVAKTEKAIAQSKTKPKSLPARLAVTTVPGPIKAAVTKIAGPNSRFFFFNMVLLEW